MDPFIIIPFHNLATEIAGSSRCLPNNLPPHETGGSGSIFAVLGSLVPSLEDRVDLELQLSSHRDLSVLSHTVNSPKAQWGRHIGDGVGMISRPGT